MPTIPERGEDLLDLPGQRAHAGHHPLAGGRGHVADPAEQQRELADLNVTIEEGLSVNGVQLAKTIGAGPALVRRFTASSARLIDLELRSQLAGRWRMSSLSIIFAAIPAVIYLAAGLPVTAGAVSIGTLVAFTTLPPALRTDGTALFSLMRNVGSAIGISVT